MDHRNGSAKGVERPGKDMEKVRKGLRRVGKDLEKVWKDLAKVGKEQKMTKY